MFKNLTDRKKAYLGIGGAVLLIGLAVFAVGIYSAFNGGDSDRGVTQEVRQITNSPSPTQSPTASPTPVPTPPLGDNPYTMIIDKIGVAAPVEAYGLDDQQVPEVPTGPGTAPGQIVAWYNFSARPGTGGNAVFAGHVTWNGTAVFYHLTSLAAGDEIKLKGQDGTLLTYVVSDVYDVDASDPNSVQVMGPTTNDALTIITCDGTTTYVGGTFGVEYNNRLVVRAGLQSVTPASAVSAGSESGG